MGQLLTHMGYNITFSAWNSKKFQLFSDPWKSLKSDARLTFLMRRDIFDNVPRTRPPCPPIISPPDGSHDGVFAT
jgi:hypothetical protein